MEFLHRIKLVEANESDLKRIVDLDQLIFNKNEWWQEVLIKGFLKNNGTKVIIANMMETNASIDVGFISFEKGGKILKIGVVPTYQNHRIGSHMLDYALEILDTAWKKYNSSSSLHVNVKNDTAMSLYLKKGYMKDTQILNYYEPGVHAWRLIRNKI